MNATYDHTGNDKNQAVSFNKSASYDVCRGHFVAFNAGTVVTDNFSASDLFTKDKWDNIWSAYIGHTDMMYAKNPTE